MGALQGILDSAPDPGNDEFVRSVPAEGFLDELEAMKKHEFFADLPAAVKVDGGPEMDTVCSKDFLYKPLVGKDEIRLLHLKHGKTGGLKGQLLNIRLADNPTYEALSYAWGPPDKPYKITLPNGILRITKSLFTALIRLRRRGKPRLLWIG
jgi:hypothetical protein